MLRSETAKNPEAMRAALAGLRRYQAIERPNRPPQMPIAAQAGRAILRDYGGNGPPAIFVPSLINPPHVLDLAEGNSLLRWLATQGVRPLLLDWGSPAADERDLSVAGHVEQLLLPLLDQIGERASLVGYCLGGTMALAAASRRPVRSLALVAAPWDFNGFPHQARTDLVDLWRSAQPVVEELGLLPMEALQMAFWRLDAAKTIRKFEDFGALPEGDPRIAAFVALEDWANDGPALTLAAGRDLLEHMFGGNITGRAEWIVGAGRVDPHALDCPVLNVVSTRDRIVPANSAAPVGERMELDLGHVGMIVGGRGREALWGPLAHWLSQPRKR